MSSPLSILIQTLVPGARTDGSLHEDLMEHCEEILSSNIGRAREIDIAHLGGIMKRQLLQSQVHLDSPAAASQRFTNLISRLLEEDGLSNKQAILLFMHSLSSSSEVPTITSRSLLPSLSIPSQGPPKHRPSNGILSSNPLSSTPLVSAAESTRPAGKTKAEILREYRAKAGSPHIPEKLLVRDCLYLLQGISGNYVYFSDLSSDDAEGQAVVFRESSKYIIPTPTRELVHRLSEIGYLYKRVSAFTNAAEKQPNMGLIKQSLSYYLQSQLTEYYRMVAVLESQLTTVTPDDQNSQAYDTGLTLRRLDVWTEDWRLRMRMMSVCVEGAKDATGGALVSLMHTYTDDGDPFIHKFTDELLEEVSKPFFVTLHRWIYSGELHDPYSEFFVAIDPALAHLQYAASGVSFDADEMKDRESGATIWKSKYRFRDEMLPRFLGNDFGRKIFSTGKSLNFIRYSCQDSEWVATRNKLNDHGKVLKYSDISGLERSIDHAYQIASQRLFDVFFNKFKLKDHLLALKQYLLLGHGDFAENLMDTLAPHLSKPANSLQRHKLTNSLETAIRATNAQFDTPDVLRRLDARMLEFTHGEIGWDVFTLEYKVDSPIDTVLDPESIQKYLRLFSHLWRLKRVDNALSACWMRITSAARIFLRVPELEGPWHHVRLCISEMIFFIRQMQTYAHLVVIESSWGQLLQFLKKKEGDLDSLIQAHRDYLGSMVTRVLLLRTKQGKEEQYLGQVKEAFNFALLFIESVDSLYSYSLAEAARLDAARDSERGIYTQPDPQRGPQSDALLRIQQRIREYASEFTERALNVALGIQSHEDPKCKVLGQILAFSEFYSNKRQRLKGGTPSISHATSIS